MSITLTTPVTKTVTVDSYQITQLGATFYNGGGELTACTLAIRGRKGSGEGAAFEQAPGEAGRVDVDLRNEEVMAILATPVANLPQDVALLEALMGLIDAALKAKGVV